MITYTVTWIVELNATDPHHAAELAREMQLDPNSSATVFHVRVDTQLPMEQHVIDLNPQE